MKNGKSKHIAIAACTLGIGFLLATSLPVYAQTGGPSAPRNGSEARVKHGGGMVTARGTTVLDYCRNGGPNPNCSRVLANANKAKHHNHRRR